MANNRELYQERIDALSNRNALKYFRLCDQLGISPEARDLYELGQAEAERKEGLEAVVLKHKYVPVKSQKPRIFRSGKTPFDYSGFLTAIYDTGSELNIEEERALLKKYGRKNVRFKDKIDSIEKAGETRVHEIFVEYKARAIKYGQERPTAA